MDREEPAWDPESSASFWIHRASRMLLRLHESRLRPLGFGMSQMPVLHALAEGGALSQKELAARAKVEQPTMAEMIARMERDGVVERAPNPKDGRGSLVSLTRRSRQRLARGKAALTAGERDAVAGLSDREKKTLIALLKRVVASLEPTAAGSAG
jgi:DNA-binding MarR family transcriptional regulator